MKVLVLVENDGERAEALQIAASLARPERMIHRGGDKRSWGGQIVRVVQEAVIHEPRILTRVASAEEVLRNATSLATDVALAEWEMA